MPDCRGITAQCGNACGCSLVAPAGCGGRPRRCPVYPAALLRQPLTLSTPILILLYHEQSFCCRVSLWRCPKHAPKALSTQTRAVVLRQLALHGRREQAVLACADRAPPKYSTMLRSNKALDRIVMFLSNAAGFGWLAHGTTRCAVQSILQSAVQSRVLGSWSFAVIGDGLTIHTGSRPQLNL